MNFIKELSTGLIFEIPEGGYPYTYDQKVGKIYNKLIASKGMYCPMFNPDGLDPVGNDVFADYQYDLSRLFEAVESDEPEPPVLDCSIALPISMPSVYKTYSGGVGGVTTFRFIINTLNDIEFSSKLTGPGSTNGLDASGYPSVWVTISKGTDGFYNVPVPSTGNVEAVWVRKVGCGGNGVLENHYTFTGAGVNPLDPVTPPDTDPPAGSGDAVQRAKPLGVKVWGFFAGRQKIPFNGVAEHNHKTHYADVSALSDDAFTSQRPFYGQNGFYYEDGNGVIQLNPNPTTVPVGIWSVSANTHIIENRYADTDHQMTMADMDWCIEYIVRSGLQYMSFEYYANGYDGAIMRTMFEQNPNKRKVKAAYTVGQFGGNFDNYGDPNDDYTKNLNHFCWAMGQDWYQRIDGKPLIFLFKDPYTTPGESYPFQIFWSKFGIELNRIRSRYAELYGNGGIYEVYMTAGISNDYTWVDYFGMDARSWYYITNEDALGGGSHNMSSANNEGVAITTALNTAGKEIAPALNIALWGLARAKYPGTTYQWNNPSTAYGLGYNAAWESSYYTPPTYSEMQGIVSQMVGLMSLSGVKTGIFSTFDELTEGGPTCLMPKKRIDNSIDDSQVMAFKSVLNPNYVIS